MIKKMAVLMPVYNGEKFLQNQINSILKQKGIEVTIFISIDQCTDNSVRLIENLKKKNKEINILSKNLKHGSPTKNYFHLISNFLIKDFDYVSLSDQDDIWHDKKLLKSIEVLDNQNYSIYSSSVNAKIGSKTKYIKKSYKQTPFDYYFESAGPGSTYVFNRKFFKDFQKYLIQNINKLKNFDHYDWLIYAFAREKNYLWYIDSQATLDYIQHNRNFTGANIGLKAFFLRLQQIFNGDALKKANNLLQILELKKIGIHDYHSLKAAIKLFFLSFKLRRSIVDKIYIAIYFFLLIFFGKNTNNRRILSFKYFLNYIVLIVFFIFFYKNFNKNIIYTITNNFYNLIYIFFTSIISLLIISFRIILTCNFFSKKKISFFSWHKNFCESQIMNYLIPFSGVIYRGYFLKDSINLSYTEYAKILIYLNFLELFLLGSLVLILLIYFHLNLEVLLFFLIIFISSLYLINKKNFALINFDLFYNLFFFKKKFIIYNEKLNFNNASKITICTYLKIIFNYFFFISIFLLFGLDISYLEILLLTLINQMFEPVKITPQNIGLTEAAFALYFFTINYDPIIGSYVKIIHRSFEFFHYFLYLFFFKFKSMIK